MNQCRFFITISVTIQPINRFYTSLERYFIEVLLLLTCTPLKAVQVLFSAIWLRDGRAVSWVGGNIEGKISCLSCILATVRYRNFILVGTLVGGCRYAMSWCDLDLTLMY